MLHIANDWVLGRAATARTRHLRDLLPPFLNQELDELKELFYGLPDFLTQLVSARLRCGQPL